MSSDSSVIEYPSPQWTAWREHLAALGDHAELLARMGKAAAAGRPMRVPKPFPTEESRLRAEAAASVPRRVATPLSEGARWLGLYGSAEEPLIDARGPLVKAGMRPSDKLVAVTTRGADLPFRETRWRADGFLRKAPALRVGQHVTCEWQRDTELKVAVAITYGVLAGRPEVLREADVIPFTRASPITRKQLVRWWVERHPEGGGEREAEAALRSMNPRELQNATLLMDNEAAQPVGNRHSVSYDPFAAAWKLSR
jgi:hypothetical protein